MKLNGSIRLNGRHWEIQCPSFVMVRLKRVFERLDQGEMGVVRLLNTPETCRELAWFLDRYPMEVTPRDVLERGAQEQRNREQRVVEILAADYVAREFPMAIKPRDYQRRAADLTLQAHGLLLADTMGLGKQQPVDSKVLTPTGWRLMGELRVGDRVIGSSGQAVLVTGVFPQGVKPSYRVRFSDGASVESGPEHLWTMTHHCGGKRWEELLLTTEQLRERGGLERMIGGRRTRLNLSLTKLYLPMLSGAVRFDESTMLPVPAYVLGQLIGNGSLAHGTTGLTTNAEDWPEVHRRLLAEGAEIRTFRTYGNVVQTNLCGLTHQIEALDLNVLSPKKRIPGMYLKASPEDRMSLLQGMMDSDGSISPEKNRLTYHTTSEALAWDVRELVQGLGGIASVREYDRSEEQKPTDYQVRMRLPAGVMPFSIARKLSRYRPGSHALPKRTLQAVEYVREVESVCIAVDAPDQLYVTEDCILTHNTCSAICVLTDPAVRPAVVVTLTHLPTQWKAEIERFVPGLRVAVPKTTRPYDLTKGGTEPFPDVVVLNYHKTSSWAEVLAPHIKGIVFDEIQELRTGEGSQKYQGSLYMAQACDYRMGLSGTPIYGYGGEIFNIVDVLFHGALGTKEEFCREWCVGPNDKPRLKEPKVFGEYLRDQGFMLRRTREDVARELPELTRIVHEIECDMDVIDEIDVKAHELAKIILNANSSWTQKGQAAMELSWKMRHATGVAKAKYVALFVRMLVESGEKVLLFGWHRECFAKGTKVLMHNGSVKNVEDVAVGDRVMGPDSGPREVKSLVAGSGKLYRVVPNKGEPWVCSENHVLSVRNGRSGQYEKWTAREFAEKSARWQRERVLYRPGPVTFGGSTVPMVEPWLVGFWIGDGAASLKDLRVSSADHEIADEMEKIAARYELRVSSWASPGQSDTSACRQMAFSSGPPGSKKKNRLLAHFRSLGLDGRKRVPAPYATASVDDRLELLAGLIDSDGHVYRGNGVGSADYTTIYRELADDVAFVARSLGFAAYVKSKTGKSGYPSSREDRTYWCVTVSGDLTTIPTRIGRKRAEPRAGQKDVLRTGFRVEPADAGEFYGFEVGDDHLFLLSDFTVAHNCYDLWGKYLEDLKPAMYTGSESGKEKEEAKRRFVEGETDVLIMSLRSGAGIDGLQGVCKVVVNGELDWSPGVHEQGVARVHRDGQKEGVTLYYLVVNEGSDPVVMDVLGIKKVQADGVHDPGLSGETVVDTTMTNITRLAESVMRKAKGLPRLPVDRYDPPPPAHLIARPPAPKPVEVVPRADEEADEAPLRPFFARPKTPELPLPRPVPPKPIVPKPTAPKPRPPNRLLLALAAMKKLNS